MTNLFGVWLPRRQVKSAAREQPLPVAGQRNVHDELRHRYGACVGSGVLDDLWAKAIAAQDKYKLPQPGLWTHNGRCALLDAYQDMLDSAIYLLQHQMECEDGGVTGTLPSDYVATLLHMAETVREELAEMGIVD